MNYDEPDDIRRLKNFNVHGIIELEQGAILVGFA